MNEYLDGDGYPTESTLEKISEWNGTSTQLLEFVSGIWWMKDMLWREEDQPHRWRENSAVRVYTLSTGGWSGNEDIIRAMERSPHWQWIWYQSRRGGHYTFEVDPAIEG